MKQDQATAEAAQIEQRKKFAQIVEEKAVIIAGASDYAPKRTELSVTPKNYACTS